MGEAEKGSEKKAVQIVTYCTRIEGEMSCHLFFLRIKANFVPRIVIA